MTDDNDDLDFLTIVRKIFNKTIRDYEPQKIYLVKIDNWFDAKWRLFSGKMLGIAGVHSYKLVVPPFIPSRILDQSCFIKFGDVYEKKELYIHVYQPSEQNLSRKISGEYQSKTFFWYCGNTKKTSRGSLMVYQAEKEKQYSYYISFLKKEEWQIYKTDKISRNEIVNLMK